ncbi:hypothetical protein D3C86_1856360 [compost metagenome]
MPHLQNVGMFEDDFRSEGVEVAATALTGVVHQHIDPAPRVCNFSNKRLDPLTVRHVDSPGNHRLGVFRKLRADFPDV